MGCVCSGMFGDRDAFLDQAVFPRMTCNGGVQLYYDETNTRLMTRGDEIEGGVSKS
jgi:hypothetical protein